SKKDPFDLATSSINLARIFYLRRKFSKALSFYTKPLEVYQKTMRSNDPRIGKLHEDIGDVYRKWKKFHTAAISYHRAAEVLGRTMEDINSSQTASPDRQRSSITVDPPSLPNFPEKSLSKDPPITIVIGQF
ncbi:unnamed protein product, partial [Rotaria sordida]